MKIDYLLVGQNIKHIRKEKHLTQKELAKMVGITGAHVSHIESGHTTLSVQTLVDIADALDTSIDKLIGRKNMSFCFDHLDAMLIETISGFSEQQLKILMAFAEQLRNITKDYE